MANHVPIGQPNVTVSIDDLLYDGMHRFPPFSYSLGKDFVDDHPPTNARRIHWRDDTSPRMDGRLFKSGLTLRAKADPPIVNSDDPHLYVGYFQNAFGEQWIFTSNNKTGEATLRGGDIGWNNAQPVKEGHVEGLILGGAESAWLQACWKAANGPYFMLRYCCFRLPFGRRERSSKILQKNLPRHIN